MFLILLIIALLAAVIYRYIILPHKYWTERGIKQGKQKFIFGDNFLYKNESCAELVERVYNKFPSERYSGMYLLLSPVLLIRDIDLIKQITVKDFDHFMDHKSSDNIFPEDVEPVWSKNLFGLKGEKWKEMRATLTPAFTSSKMKAMFVLMSDCADRFTNYFINNPDECTLEFHDIFSRFINDVIATCAFGIEIDSMKNKTNEFYCIGKGHANRNLILTLLKLLFYTMSPRLFKFLGIRYLDPNYEIFFNNIIRQTMKYREEHNIVRPDMIQLMMEARKGQLEYEENLEDGKNTCFATVEESSYGKTAKKCRSISDMDITAHSLSFFVAGFDTTATLMCFLGYELAANPEIQEKLFIEISKTDKSCEGKLTYDLLNKMKYLDMVVAETLRKWPIAVAINRLCVKPYTIEPQSENEKPLHIPKNTHLWIPIWGIHRDPKYYPNPTKFDPERFNDENKVNIKPYTYLPFGVGPRICLGNRFALLETKVLFYHLILKFEIIPNERTEIPLILVKNGVTFGSKNGFNFSIKSRTNN